MSPPPTIVVERPRTFLRAWGRDPVKMIDGLATASLAEPLADRAVYTAFLTTKGRMVADARVILLREGELRDAAPAERELLITTDPAAEEALVAHLRKFVPPLFARFEDVSAAWRVVGVYGPSASAVARTALAGAALAGAGGAGGAAGVGGAGSAPRMEPDAPEDTLVRLPTDPPSFAFRTAEAGGDGWELVVPAERAGAVRDDLIAAGGEAASAGELEERRIRAGRPRWGAELTDSVIPLEAGLLDRAISQSKGCYTGQEVIVRILHRGHVNRHLRRLRFEGAPPAPGTELFEEGGEKVRGTVTSAAAGPVAVGLGYVRREIEPPAELRAGAPDGPPVRVEALEDPGEAGPGSGGG